MPGPVGAYVCEDPPNKSKMATLRHADGSVTVDIDPVTARYNISTPAGVQLRGLQYTLTLGGKDYTSDQSGGLILAGPGRPFEGADNIGPFKAMEFHWHMTNVSAEKDDANVYVTSFRVYEDAVVFRQEFPLGGKGMKNAKRGFVAEFPALEWSSSNPPAGFVTWNGGMSGDGIKTGRWPSTTGDFGARDGGPVAIFSGTPAPPAACALVDQTSGSPCVNGTGYGCFGNGSMWVDKGCAGTFQCQGHQVSCSSDGFKRKVCPCTSIDTTSPSGWAIVVSEASRFMAGGVGACGAAPSALCSGLRGSYDSLPRNFSFETILSVTSTPGVASAMHVWGSHLLAKFGKQRTHPWAAKSDYITKLGYSSTGW